MKVRLTRKFAEQIDGIDLSAHEVGDMLDLPFEQARLIVAENCPILTDESSAHAVTHRRRAEDQAPGAPVSFSGRDSAKA